jgi:type I restriction enzyme S subunit
VNTIFDLPTPKGWAQVPMWTIAKRKDRKGYPDAELLSVYREFGVIRKSDRDDNHNVESDDLSAYKYVKRGDLVLNKMKTWQGSLGVSSFDGIVSPAYFICELSPMVHGPYIHHLLRSQPYIAMYGASSKGIRVGQWDLPFDEFRSIPVLLPPLTEQVKIASFVDTMCKSLDENISASNKLIDLSEEVLLSKINELFDEKPSPNFLLGKEGKSISLFRAGVRCQAGQTPKSSEPEFWTNSGSGTPWLSIGDMVSREYVEISEKDVTESGLAEIGMSPNKGDVLLFAMYASMGKVSFARAGFVWSQAILGLTTNSLNRYFLAAWLEISRPNLKALARSSTQDNLNAEQVMSLRIPIVDKIEQDRIGEKYRNLLEEHALRIALLGKQSAALKELKTSIITSAVTEGILTKKMEADRS